MERKEVITYTRRPRTGERPQPVFKSNPFHGYRTTKQWVEEASQQCRVLANGEAEQEQNECDGTAQATSTPSRIEMRKKDGRGVHFKQENEQTGLTSKVAFEASLSPGTFRKDCFPDSQAAALSPISLNVAAGGRQVSNAFTAVKQSPAVEALPQGVKEPQGQIAVISPDGKVQGVTSKTDNEGKQVVWCNAAFEADDDLRSYKSHDSARSNRFSPASCSKLPESNVSSQTKTPSLNQQQEQAVTSGHFSKDAKAGVMFSPAIAEFSPAISSASAVAGSSPATAMTISPHEDDLPYIAQLELEATVGDLYTPLDSDTASQSSRSFSRAREPVMDLSKTRRTLAAMPLFKAATPPTSLTSNRHCGAKVSSARDERPLSSKCFPEAPSKSESAKGRNSNKVVAPRTVTPLRSFTSDGNFPKNVKRAAGTAPVWCGKVDHRALGSIRSAAPKQQRIQPESKVEADLEADIEQEIEAEIAKEILQLSQRLAVLHAKQETRKVGVGLERPKSGGISCPQTPVRSAPSPSSSDTANKRKGRVVAAKFLQYKNDASNSKHGPADKNEKSTSNPLGFSDGPFLGRPNPPRRSLGTPSCLLTRGKPNAHQRPSSPNRAMNFTMIPPPDSEARSRGNTATKVNAEEYVRDTAVLDSGGKRILSRKNLGEDERKDWNQGNDKGAGQNRKDQPALSASTGSAAMPHTQFYPEFERKVDWVKTLRTTGPLPAAHHCAVASSPGQALDERFLKQKSERQDIHAWLRENMGEAQGNGEIPSSSAHPFPSSTVRATESAVLEGGQDDVRTMPRKFEEDQRVGLTSARSTQPGNSFTTPSRTARTPTPNRRTPTRTTPSSANARTVPSRYGTPVKPAPARARTPNGSRSGDPKLVLESPGVAKRWCGQANTSPRQKGGKDVKGGLILRKASPTIRRGYPGAFGVNGGCTPVENTPAKLKSEGEISASNHNRLSISNSEGPKVDKKITVVEAEYETFVEEGVHLANQGSEAVSHNAAAAPKRGRAQRVGSKPESLTGLNESCEPFSSSSVPQSAKKIFIRCSDLIKDKHYHLMKSKQRHFTGQSVLPSECQDSDDSVFARSNTRTDSSELDERSEASIIEECNPGGNAGRARQPIPFPKRGDPGAVQFVTGSSKKSRLSPSPEYDIVYDYESGNPRLLSYLPEDYTLDMMLEYVDTLKSEREGLPRIRATKDVVVGSTSPRDSGCIKRTRESERRDRFYFKGGQGAVDNKEQGPRFSILDNEGLSPSEIEGLDLESFWCLVGGDLEGPIKIPRP